MARNVFDVIEICLRQVLHAFFIVSGGYVIGKIIMYLMRVYDLPVWVGIVLLIAIWANIYTLDRVSGYTERIMKPVDSEPVNSERDEQW